MIDGLTTNLFNFDKVNEEMDKLHFCKCGNKKRSWLENMCWKCEDKQKEDEKNEYLANKKNMTLEERISKIEEWIYNHSQNHPAKEFRMR